MLSLLKLLINPFYINIGLLILWAIVILNNKKIKDRNRIFVYFAAIQWILISGLRHITIGGRDVYISYNYSFERAINTRWIDAGKRFVDSIFYGSGVKDPGYMIFEKIIGVFTSNYQIYLFVVAIVFMIPFGIFVYRNSKEPFMSFLIYSTLFYSFFSLTGFRQTIATALVVLWGYELIKKRNLLGFIALTVIAFTIHKSAIVFFPFYFLAQKKLTKKYLIIICLVAIVLFVFGNRLYSPIATVLGYEYMLENEIGGTQTFALMMVLVSCVGFWRMKQILKNNPQSHHFFNATIIALIFSLLAIENQSFMRIQQYYSIFIVLLIPEIIKSFNSKERIMVYYVSISVLMFLFLKNDPKYLFFWQE